MVIGLLLIALRQSSNSYSVAMRSYEEFRSGHWQSRDLTRSLGARVPVVNFL